MTNQQRKPKRVRKNLVLRRGVWYYRRVVDGTRVCVSTKQTDYQLAEEVATDLDGKINRESVDTVIGKKLKPVAAPTFTAYAEDYLAVVSPAKTYDQAEARDRKHLAHAMTFFGETPIDAITSAQCEKFLAHIRTIKTRYGGPPSVSTQRLYMSSTEVVFNRAVENAVITVNPFRRVAKAAKPKSQAKNRVITVEEQTAIDAALERDDLRRAFRVILFAGLRIDEVVRLRVEHVDFANGDLRLPADICKGKKHGRTIPMQPIVEEALSEQVAERGLQRQPAGRLFGFSKYTLWRHFAAAAEAAHVLNVTPHDCRRTYASRCANAGVPIGDLQKCMGHADVKTLMKHYVRTSEESTRRNMRVDIGAMALKVLPFRKEGAR